MKLTRRSWPVFLLVALAMAAGMFVVYVVVVFVWVLDENSVDRMEFSSEAWISTPAELSFDSVRLRMVDSLLRKHSLYGKSRAEIVGLLGEPDETNYFADYEMVYWLGPERSWMSVDSEWLLIDLDDQDQVNGFRLGTD